MIFRSDELAAHLLGAQTGPEVRVDGASIDSRTIRPGQLYVPIVAERDGHGFIPKALEAGASAYLTAREPVGGTAIGVPDTAAALLDLGRLARDRVGGAIGITGSVGKTTTKDLLAACLASTFRTAASERSFNNELGLPLTLLNAPDDARWVVLEMGARREGDIGRLAEVARPDVGIVTSVAMAHLEYMGDLDGVARAKGELVAALPPSGLAVLNFDDPRVRAMSSLSAARVLGYGMGADAEVRAEDVALDRDLRARFRLSSPWGRADVRLALRGAHQVANALAAAAAALWCGVPIEAVAATLAESQGSPMRMDVRRVPGGPVLVVDCFNAIPASAEAAVRSLAALPGERKLAILGTMAELGDRSESEHRRIAALADGLGIEVVGYKTDLYGGAQAKGVEEAVGRLSAMGPGDAALVKGSRVVRLEDVVRAVGASGEPAKRTRAEMAKAVADDGWSVVGVLAEPLRDRLLQAVDEVAARSSDLTDGGQLHQLSGLAQHPDLVEVIDWEPLLGLAVELLSPNIYINHSHLDVHPPHPPTGARRWHRDNGLMGRDMRLAWRDQPRVTLKVAVYLTDVLSADDGALEVVPGSHLDRTSRYPDEEQPDGVPILGPAGTVAVFDARLWHRRRDNLGTHVRRAMFWAYSYRWLTSRDIPFEAMPEWAGLHPIRRQLLGDPTVDPFYWAPAELPLDRR